MRRPLGPALAAWRGRAPVWLGMAAIVAVSWLYLARMNAGMPVMAGGGMTAMSDVGVIALGMVFTMWVVMMLAMMLPSIVPAASLFMKLAAGRDPDQTTAAGALYVAGYTTPWIAFSVPVALAQWALTRSMLLDPMAQSASAILSAVILLGAGVFQFTSLKDACLTRCRTPLGFFLAEWRDGLAGAFVLGLRHGSFCVGCCWALMAVMFVVGAMNLVWMGALTLFVLAEKALPARWMLDRIAGGVLIACGIGTLLWV